MQIAITVPDAFFGLRKKGFNIIDPTSLFGHEGKIYLGLCASEREWFHRQRFLNLLVALPLAEFTDLLNQLGVREKYKLIVGGAITTKNWADSVGADGWGAQAKDGLDLAKELLGVS